MNLQYISDSTGQEEIDIPGWQMDVVKERLADYINNPDNSLDFNSAMDDIWKTR